MVYGLGNNTAGCLGIGNTNCTLFPKKVEALCGKDIKTFAYNNGPNVLALTKEGEVYSWGRNKYGELGNGTHDQIVTPTLVNISNLEGSPGTKRVVDIACGSSHSVALTENGEVYTWGIKVYGQNTNILTNDTPTQVISNLATKKVVYLTCGATFTMAVTENGEVYSWGNNDVGQLGIGNYENQTLPNQIDTLRDIVIVKVVCGIDYTLALTNEGDLYVWGGNYNQLAICSKQICYNKPVLVEHQMGRVSDIVAVHNKFISIAIGEDGRVYVWGNCSKKKMNPSVTPFSNVYNALSTSDLKIQVEGRYIHVHKAILKIRSLYFKTMFQLYWAKTNPIVIKNQFSYVVYKAFLKYLYTDVINLPCKKVVELLAVAKKYRESSLKKHCIQMIN
ncbi:RCC1 and BTB domain-containing protein 1 [Trachymyrmex septentrionalis]|uniref:RCC1 and BTB domain-containing protein 1 n=1 Tax=Trachymyrmex septentrionalis TaxID=34720 RepID=A0A151JTL2_9HYME|nr:RCC1 and BTB domain-containing protein 1 [Trachymyrmex septentrionalis]